MEAPVSLIYYEFRAIDHPDEDVIVNLHTGEVLIGAIKDTVRFAAKSLSESTLRPPLVRYFLSLTDRPLKEAVLDSDHIRQIDGSFTKRSLQIFLNRSMTISGPV
jgi:hypothetical protein